jgi:drug/metabolite transporter (DMT)-like permease
MILGAALSYALAALVVKRRFTGVPSVGVAASTIALSAIAYLPLAALTWPASTPGADTIACLFALGAGGTGIAFLLYYALIAEYGPARAAVIAYIAPAFAVVYGVVLLDESLTAGTIAGLLLILAGSWLAAQGRLPARLSRTGLSRSSEPAPVRAR